MLKDKYLFCAVSEFYSLYCNLCAFKKEKKLKAIAKKHKDRFFLCK